MNDNKLFIKYIKSNYTEYRHEVLLDYKEWTISFDRFSIHHKVIKDIKETFIYGYDDSDDYFLEINESKINIDDIMGYMYFDDEDKENVVKELKYLELKFLKFKLDINIKNNNNIIKKVRKIWVINL